MIDRRQHHQMSYIFYRSKQTNWIQNCEMNAIKITFRPPLIFTSGLIYMVWYFDSILTSDYWWHPIISNDWCFGTNSQGNFCHFSVISVWIIFISICIIINVSAKRARHHDYISISIRNFPTTPNANKSREYEMTFVLPGRFALKPKIYAR